MFPLPAIRFRMFVLFATDKHARSYYRQWTNFTMGPYEQNQHFADLRQKVCLYIHVEVQLRSLQSLVGKLERFDTNNGKSGCQTRVGKTMSKLKFYAQCKCLDHTFWFPAILGKICPFSFDDFSLITGPKTTNIIHLKKQSYSLLKYIKIVIVGPEIIVRKNIKRSSLGC